MPKSSLASLLALACIATFVAGAEKPSEEKLVAAKPTTPARATTAPASRADVLLAALEDPSDPRAFVVAHRGDWRFFPENSLDGIDHAIEVGSDMIETDLRRTRDGRFVIMHDKTLDRTTTGTGAVADRTLAEIRAMRLRDALGRPSHHSVPTAEEVLALVRGRALIYLDKTEDCIDEVEPIVRRMGMERYAFFYGRRPAGELSAKWGALASQLRYVPKLDPATPDATAYVRDLKQLLKPSVYILEFDRDDSPVVGWSDTVRASGARVWVSPIDPLLCGSYTDERAVRDPQGSWGSLLDHGVTVFCTDRPAELVRFLRSRNLHD